jgi:arginine/lysine/ornithine decarboxylase
MPTEMLPRDAFLGTTTEVPWRQAAGRISAEMICPYPPGIPIFAPGERLSAEVVDHLEQTVALGGRSRAPATKLSRRSASSPEARRSSADPRLPCLPAKAACRV